MRSTSASASLLAALLLLAACSQDRPHAAEFVALGTIVNVTAYGADKAAFEDAIAELEASFAMAGRAWYPRADGELRALNDALAAGIPATVSPALLELLARAIAIETASDGRFNACLGRLSELWGFYDLEDTPPALPAAADIADIIARAPACRLLALDEDALAVRSDNPVLAVDVGGIAKGVLLDTAREILRRHGIGNAIVNLGGDLAVTGSVNGRAARIGIRGATGGLPVAGLDVDDGEAVMSSGNYERYREVEGRRYSHILDPATGWPVSHTAAVTVVHRDATLADAAATALLVGGPSEFDALTKKLSIEFALLVDAKGDTSLTPAMAARLHWTRNPTPD